MPNLPSSQVPWRRFWNALASKPGIIFIGAWAPTFEATLLASYDGRDYTPIATVGGRRPGEVNKYVDEQGYDLPNFDNGPIPFPPEWKLARFWKLEYFSTRTGGTWNHQSVDWDGTNEWIFKPYSTEFDKVGVSWWQRGWDWYKANYFIDSSPFAPLGHTTLHYIGAFAAGVQAIVPSTPMLGPEGSWTFVGGDGTSPIGNNEYVVSLTRDSSSPHVLSVAFEANTLDGGTSQIVARAYLDDPFLTEHEELVQEVGVSYQSNTSGTTTLSSSTSSTSTVTSTQAGYVAVFDKATETDVKVDALAPSYCLEICQKWMYSHTLLASQYGTSLMMIERILKNQYETTHDAYGVAGVYQFPNANRHFYAQAWIQAYDGSMWDMRTATGDPITTGREPVFAYPQPISYRVGIWGIGTSPMEVNSFTIYSTSNTTGAGLNSPFEITGWGEGGGNYGYINDAYWGNFEMGGNKPQPKIGYPGDFCEGDLSKSFEGFWGAFGVSHGVTKDAFLSIEVSGQIVFDLCDRPEQFALAAMNGEIHKVDPDPGLQTMGWGFDVCPVYWNTVRTPDGNEYTYKRFTVDVTPARGTLDVYSVGGKMLEYGRDYVEDNCDKSGRSFRLLREPSVMPCNGVYRLYATYMVTANYLAVPSENKKTTDTNVDMANQLDIRGF